MGEIFIIRKHNRINKHFSYLQLNSEFNTRCGAKLFPVCPGTTFVVCGMHMGENNIPCGWPPPKKTALKM
jgi:hypothetical protein